MSSDCALGGVIGRYDSDVFKCLSISVRVGRIAGIDSNSFIVIASFSDCIFLMNAKLSSGVWLSVADFC